MASTEELAVKLAEVEQRGKSNTYRVDKLEERQDNLDKLVTSVTALATEQKQLKTDVTEIKSDVKALAAMPGKRWNALVGTVIATLIAGVIGFMLAQVGI